MCAVTLYNGYHDKSPTSKGVNGKPEMVEPPESARIALFLTILSHATYGFSSYNPSMQQFIYTYQFSCPIHCIDAEWIVLCY